MANLPTAYASQRFGNKTLDFYAAAGEVVGADPRARAEERRLQDFDGARHTVRLMEAKAELEPGDQASVLRLQPGPARRSRPVAVVNHSRRGWTRTHPGASALLSRAGVARNVNWALTMALFAAAALIAVWPYIHAFLFEIAPAGMRAVPALDVFALAVTALPGLADLSIAAAAAPLAELLGQVRPGLENLAPGLLYGAGALAGAVIVFAARSWRLLWAPLFVGALGAGALAFGGPQAALIPFLSGLGVAAVVFAVGGAWNRVSDSLRLEARIALLADHLMSNAPEETVAAPEPAEADAAPAAPVTDEAPLIDERTAVAVAASLRSLDGEGGEGEAPETQDAPSADTAEAETDEAESQAEPESMAAVLEAARDSEEEPDEAPEDAAPQADAGEPETADAVDDEAEPASADAADTAEAETSETETAEPEPTEPETADPVAPVAATEDEPALAEAPDAGEAERPDSIASAGLDAEEAERLRTDPRYASRAILLPPPPPMPAPRREAGAEPASGEASGATDLTAGAATPTRTLTPARSLPDNVVPIFAAPPPKREDEPV